MLAMLCFLSVIGTILCAAGIITNTSIFKGLLITLSVLGIVPLPVAVFYGQMDAKSLMVLAILGQVRRSPIVRYAVRVFIYKFDVSQAGAKHSAGEQTQTTRGLR